MHKHGLKSRVLSPVLFAFVFFLVLAAGRARAFEVSPEIEVDTPIYTLPAWGDQVDPAIAFNGSIYLAVWYQSEYPDRFVFGARADENGLLLDHVPITIYEGEILDNITAATDGDDFLVVWSGFEYRALQILAQRISSTGELLDPTYINLTPNGSEAGHPSLAFDGVNYMVAYHDMFNWPYGSMDVMGVRISPAGEVLDPDGFIISNYDGWQTMPSLAFNGANYLAVWEDTRDLPANREEIYGTRITPEGEVLDTPDILVATGFLDQSVPQVVSNGTDFMAVWIDYRNGSDYRLYGARIAATGAVLDPQPFPISQTGIIEEPYTMASDGNNYLLTWGGDPSWRMRIGPDGGFLDPEPVPFLNLGARIDGRQVIGIGTDYFAVWSDDRLGDFDVYAARVSAEGEALDQEGWLYSGWANSENYPAAAFDGTNYLVVWEDDRNSANGQNYFLNIYGARIAPDGTSLDPKGLPIALGRGYLMEAEVAFNGENYLVVWNYMDEEGNGRDIYGTRVSPAGQVLDPDFITISAGGSFAAEPTVASDGQNFFITWYDYRLGAADIFGARIDADGTLLDPIGFPISRAVNAQYDPAAAFGTDAYLVAWQDHRYDSGYSQGEIYGARVRADGTVLEETGFPISLEGFGYYDPILAFGAQVFLVVWGQLAEENVWGARVDTGGQVLDADSLPISMADQDQTYPRVVFDGVNFFVVWQDARLHNLDIYGSRVSPGGAILDLDGQIISGAPESEDLCALATNGQGQTLVTYRSYPNSVDPPYQPVRVRCRLVNIMDDDTVDDDTMDDDTTDDDTADDDMADDDTVDDDVINDDSTDDDSDDDDAADDDAVDDDSGDDDSIDDDTLADDDAGDDAGDDDASDDDTSGGSESHHHSQSDDGQWCG